MEKIKSTLRDSAFARWIALALISATMFFAYFFVDVVAPLQKMMLTNFNWSPEVFGYLGGSEFVLNVFVGFLILSGIILDKMGIRFTLILSGLTMIAGAAIKFSALKFIDHTAVTSIFGWELPSTAFFAFVGFAIFGVGVEMAGITVSKTIVKWFKGKEMALAMGLEMAVARLGVFAVFRLSPYFANAGSENPADWDAPNSVFMGLAFLCIGFLTFLTYVFIDKKLDKQLGDEAKLAPEDEFKFSDLGKIFTNPGFLSIAALCVIFYSAIFPFQKFATDMLSSKLNMSIQDASNLFSYFPIGAMVLTPFIGLFLDFKGKGASLMLYGAILLVVSHLIFALIPSESFSYALAFGTIVILGTAFSLVPASMWPSIPKIVEDRYLGTAYGCIFWIQNMGLMAVPGLIGWSISKSNPGVAEQIAQGVQGVSYNYTVPELIFASFGVLAIFLSFVLKYYDKKKGYGLEIPNRK
ncbi:MAG: major facilitator superfamily domain-containing protein 1 [Bacteroidales bacterium]|nr:MAG: major facilitator superfamily domain-containing protein 1 [Bacteroidales bacterium]